LRKRTVVFLILGVVVVIVTLLALGWFPQEMLRSSLEARLRAALGPRSSIKRIAVVPGGLRAEVWDLVIEGPTYRLEVPHARVALAAGFIFGRDLVLNSVWMENPRLHLRPVPGPAKEPTIRQPMLIHNLKVTGGTVTYAPPPPNGELILRDVALDGPVGFDGVLQVASSGGLWNRAQPLPFIPTQARLKVSSKLEVEVESFEGGTPLTRVKLSGHLGRVGVLHPDLKLDVDLGLRDLRQIEALPAMEGRVALSGRLSQPADALHIETQVNGSGLRLAGWPVDRASGRLGYYAEGEGRAVVSLALAGFGGQSQTDVTFEGSRLQGRMRFSGVDSQKLARQGVNLGVPFSGALSGDVSGSGDLRSGIDVRATLAADGQAFTDYGLKARGSASGLVRPRDRFVDLRWTLNVDADRRGGTSMPRLEAVRLSGNGQARGAIPAAVDGSFQGTAQLRTAGGVEPVPVKGTFRSHRGAALVDLTAEALGGTITAKADMRRSFVQRLDLGAPSLDLARLSPDAKGQASLTLTASGPLDRLSGTGRLEGRDVVWAGATVGTLLVDLRGTAGVAQLTLQAPELNLTGEGRLDRRQLVATLHLSNSPLEPLQPLISPGRPLAGIASGTVNVTMPLASPRQAVVQARLEGVEVRSGTMTVRAARPFTITSRDRGVEVQDLQLEAPGVSFQGSGRVGLEPKAPVSLKGTIDADLTKLSLPPGWTATGRVRGDVTVSGSLDRPRGEGAVTLSGVTVQRPGWPLVQVADGEVTVQGDEVSTSGIRVSLPGGTMNISGRVPLAALINDPATRERFGLAADRGLDLHADLDVDLASLATSPGWTLAGRVQGLVSLTGTMRRPSPTGTLNLSGVRFARPGMPVMTIPSGQVALQGDVIRTDGITAQVAGGTVVLTGDIPLSTVLGEARAADFGFTAGEARMQVRWEAIDVQQMLEEMRPDHPSRVTGTLAGRLDLHGSVLSPASLSGDLDVPATTLRVQDLPFEISPLRIHIEGGQISAEAVTVAAGGGVFRATGSADLVHRTIDASGKGMLELRALSPLLEEASLEGQADVDVSVSGPLSSPASRGTVEVRGATLRVREVPQALTDINGTLTLDGRRITLQNMTGKLGGGELTMTGSAAIAGLSVAAVDVALTARDAAVRYPIGGIHRATNRLADIKARIDADLKLTGQPGSLLLAGAIKVKRALYDADIFIGEGLFAPAVPPSAHTPSRFLQSIALNVSVDTENPMIVRNNLAQLEATGSWSVRGDLDTPAPFGRLELLPGGKAVIQGREFTIDSGSLTYNGTTQPEISIRATTEIRNVKVRDRLDDVLVTVNVSGTLDLPTVNISSDQALSQEELVSLIATGNTGSSLSSGGRIVGQQAAALFAEKFTREIAHGLLDLGFDTVDIQPELLSREADPGARFTFSKDVTPRVRLVYSFGLNSPEAQYYQAQFRLNPGRELLLTVRRLDDGTFTYGAGQRLLLGGPKRPAPSGEFERTKLQAVKLEGDRPGQPPELGAGLTEAQLLGRVKTAKPGKTVSYFDLQNDSDLLREYLIQQGYLEAIVEPALDGGVAVFHVRPGPKHTWRVEGMDNPPDIGKVILSSLFDEEAQERGRQFLLDELHRRGYLKAIVDTSEILEGAGRTLLFTVKQGPKLTVAELGFPGATVLGASELEKAAGGVANLLSNPKDAERGIKAAYQERQYLTAEIGPTRVAEEGGQVRIVVPIKEGPPAVVSQVRFEGATRPEEELRTLAAIEPGLSYDANAVSVAVQRLRDLYLRTGHPAVRVIPNLAPSGSDLVLTFKIAEGEAVVVGPITITGLKHTRQGLVRSQIDLKAGEPLDPRKLSNLERRLLDLGIFSRAVVVAEPGNPAPIKIDLEEAAPYKLAYDLRYNSQEGGSGLVDGEAGNLFGSGFSLGGRYRAGRQLRETRLSLHIPSLWRLGDLTASVFRLREQLAQELLPPPSPPTEPIIAVQKGAQVQQAIHAFHPFELLYGYRFKQVTVPSPYFAIPIVPRVAGLDASAVYNTRDNPLDSLHGQFYSLTMELDHSGLGSDFSFVKGFSQAFLTRRLGTSLTWAHGYRLGLAAGLNGQRVPGFTREFSERFRAGGANSVRGYATDELGERDPLTLEPVGGEAVVVINQELRFAGPRNIGGAVFYDGGNVFDRIKDFSLSLRHSVGFGLRYGSAIGLVRVDLAFPLNRRRLPDGRFQDRGYQIWFGLGQAF
jgi:outer membrane protein assembly factor BamA/autotransporter translocation and assembly factor TamB